MEFASSTAEEATATNAAYRSSAVDDANSMPQSLSRGPTGPNGCQAASAVRMTVSRSRSIGSMAGTTRPMPRSSASTFAAALSRSG